MGLGAVPRGVLGALICRPRVRTSFRNTVISAADLVVSHLEDWAAGQLGRRGRPRGDRRSRTDLAARSNVVPVRHSPPPRRAPPLVAQRCRGPTSWRGWSAAASPRWSSYRCPRRGKASPRRGAGRATGSAARRRRRRAARMGECGHRSGQRHLRQPARAAAQLRSRAPRTARSPGRGRPQHPSSWSVPFVTFGPRIAQWLQVPGCLRPGERVAAMTLMYSRISGTTGLGYGSGTTCWRRLAEWNKAGVWQRLHEVLLDRLRAADALDFSRAAVDSSQIRALRGADRSISGRSRAGRQQAPPGHGGHRHPARGDRDRRQPQATSPSYARCRTPSRRYAASAAGPASAPRWYSPTAATTTTSTASWCASCRSTR